MKYSEAKVLQQEAKKRKECICLLEELQQQKKELIPTVNELEKSNQKEQSNVKKLQSISLTSVFYSLTGKKEDKLNEKRQEAAVLKTKYESAVRELGYIEEKIRKAEEELSQIMECEKEFNTYIEESYELLKTTKPADFSKVVKIEQEMEDLEHKSFIAQEAVTLGKDLEWDIHNMLIILDIAEKTKTELRMSQVGSAAKLYDYIDKAQTAVVKLQNKLVIFREKLDELSVDTEIQVDTESFMHILDVPMSAMISDNMSIYFAIADKVQIVSKSFQPIKGQLEEIMQNLYGLEAELKKNMINAREELEDIIIESSSI